ncbi:MAG: PAS domain-containing protein [Opitutales bacterium]|nr:PAS domain-containing protein [Opitutales bacterium]MCH8539422.1 PAS domain-containing protein [Opitutales bacterium]
MKTSNSAPHPDCLSGSPNQGHSFQPFACFLAGRADDEIIHAISANASEVSGLPRDETILGRPISDLFDGFFPPALARTPPGSPLLLPLNNQRLKKQFYGTFTRDDHWWQLQVEPFPQSRPESSHSLPTLLHQLSTAESMDALLGKAAFQFRRLLRFNRVLIIRFEEDNEGEVVAESLQGDGQRYLGYHFPLSEIPPEVRDLYKVEPLRFIPDTRAPEIPLLWGENIAEKTAFDLTSLSARPPATVHRKYLTSMGVGSSLSISLTNKNRLWGLITATNQEPCYISPPLRENALRIAEEFSQLVDYQEKKNHFLQERKLYQEFQNLRSKTNESHNFATFFQKNTQEILRITKSSGIAFCHQNSFILSGKTPRKETIQKFLEAKPATLKAKNSFYLHSRSQIQSLLGIKEWPPSIAGMALFRQGDWNDPAWVMVFREEWSRSLDWEGSVPENILSLSPENTALGPDHSFARWLAKKKESSRPWSEPTRKFLSQLCSLLVTTYLWETNQRKEEDLEKSESQREIFLSAIPDPMALVSFSGDVLRLHQTENWPFTWKPSPNPMTPQRIWDIFPHDIAKKLEQLLSSQPVQPLEFVHCFERTAEEKQFIEFRVTPDNRRGQCLVILRDVSEKQKKETNLRLMSLIAQNTKSQAIITGPDRRIQWANKAFSEVTGYSLEEVFGRKPGDFLQGPLTNPKVVQDFAQALQREEGFSTEILNYRKTGELYWIQTEIQPVHDENGNLTHFVALQRDITEKKESEKKLHASEEKLRTIMQNVPGIIFQFVRSPTGRYRFSYLTDPEDLLGLPELAESKDPEPIFARIPPSHLSKVMRSLEKSAFTQKLFYIECPYEHPNKGDIWLRVSATPRRFKDGSVIYEGYAEDITRSKLTTIRLAEATKAANAANQAKTEFLNNMSHDLRTPLSSIIGLSSLLEKNTPGEQEQRWIRVLRDSAYHQMSLINDLLDLAKIEAGKVSLNPEPLELRCFVEAIVDLFALEIGEKELELSYRMEFPEPAPWIKADNIRLRQVLINLLSNAIKFTKQGKVSLVLRSLSPESIEILVQDTGEGLTAQEKAAVFEPFMQFGEHRNTSTKGVGLGLAIVQRLIHLMNGQMFVESEKGVGSSFIIHLPVESISTSEICGSQQPLDCILLILANNEEQFRDVSSLLQGTNVITRPYSDLPSAAKAIPDFPPEKPIYIFVPHPLSKKRQAQIEHWKKEWSFPCPQPLFLGTHYSQDPPPSCYDKVLLYPLTRANLVSVLSPSLLKEEPKPPSQPLQTEDLNQTPEAVLIAEDYPANSEILGFQLQELGCSGVFAMDGEELVYKWKKNPTRFVLIDLKMPKKDGFAAAREIRGLSKELSLPVILVACTADYSQATREKCQQAGFDFFLTKPINSDELHDILKTSKVAEEKLSCHSSESDLWIRDRFDKLLKIARTQNNTSRFRDIYLNFAMELPRDIKTLTISSSPRERKNLAHRLKGSLHTLSFTRAAIFAEKIENNPEMEYSALVSSLQNLHQNVQNAWEMIRQEYPEFSLPQFPEIDFNSPHFAQNPDRPG